MSGTKRLLLAVAVLCLGVRCIVVPVPAGRGRVYVPPPPSTVMVAPPPPPRMLSEGEAVNIGLRYCQSHSIPCDLQESHLTGNGVWKVKFKVRGPGEKGHVHIDINGQTGALLHVDEKLKGR